MPNPLHVAVDATAIPASRGGVGRYLEHLVPALAAAGVRLTVLSNTRDAGWLGGLAPDASVVPVPAARRALTRFAWEQLGLPRVLRRSGADLLFSPHYTMPLAAGRPVVVTLHDATFFTHPRAHRLIKRWFFRGWTRLSARRAAALVVPSDATAAELRRALGRNQAMVVARHGVDAATFHPPAPAELDAARDMVGSESWVAFLGTVEPRKNVGELVRAFELLTPGDSDGAVLVIAGQEGWDASAEQAARTSLSRVRRLGFVDDALLPGLLGGARAVVYPSAAEGFGLPVAEAMACGTTVVTTRAPALAEVGGDAVVYADPTAASIADALRGVLRDPALRAERARAGLARAAGFTWAESARRHIDAFERAVA